MEIFPQKIENTAVDAVLIPKTFADVQAPEVILHLKDAILTRFANAAANLPAVNSEYMELAEIELSSETVTPELEKRAKELRKMVVAIEKDIEAVHKESKRAFLESGRYVDALKNTGISQTERIKDVCDTIKDFRKNEEIKAYNALTKERTELIYQALYPTPTETPSDLLFEINRAGFYVPAGLGGLTELQFDQVLQNAEEKREFNEMKAAKAAEEERLRIEAEKEKEAENARLRAENAEKDRLHQEKIKVYQSRAKELFEIGVQEIPANLAEMSVPDYTLFFNSKRDEFYKKQVINSRKNELFAIPDWKIIAEKTNFVEPDWYELTQENFDNIIDFFSSESIKMQAEKKKNEMLLARYRGLLANGWAQTHEKNYEKSGKIITRPDFLEKDEISFKLLVQGLENEIRQELEAAEAERMEAERIEFERMETERIEKERIEAEKQRILAKNDMPLWATYFEKFDEISMKLAEIEGIKLDFCHAENRVLFTNASLAISEIRNNLSQIKEKINSKIV